MTLAELSPHAAKTPSLVKFDDQRGGRFGYAEKENIGVPSQASSNAYRRQVRPDHQCRKASGYRKVVAYGRQGAREGFSG